MARAEAIQPSRSTGKLDEIEKLMSSLGRVAPCKRVEFSRLKWRPRQSLSRAAAYRVLRGVW